MANSNDSVLNFQHPAQRWHGSPGAAAQAALGGVFERVVGVLGHGLRQALDKVDDALFLRAENAQNHSEYTEYFETMRSLRRARKTIEASFITGMTQYFEQGCPLDAAAGGASASQGATPDAEESLAISVMIDKVRNNSAPNLSVLDRRIGFLIEDPDLEQWRNPLGPEAVCAAFCQAVACLQAGLVVRLLVYKLFDQYVAMQLPALYRETAQTLARAGVLPGVTGGSAEVVANERRSPTATRAREGIVERVPMAPGIVPSQSTQPLWPEADAVPLAPGIVPDRPYLESEPGREDGVAGSGLDALIHKVVDLCSVPMAPGIVPSGAPGPAPGEGHSLTVAYGKQNRTLVDSTISTEQPDNGAVPGESPASGAIAEPVMQSSVKAEAAGSGCAPGPVGDALHPSGERLQPVCREASTQAMSAANNDDAGLDFVKAFVAGHWKNLLYLVSAREGKESRAWAEATQTMDDLVWSVKPKRTAEQRRRLIARQPGLVDALRRGMQRLSIEAGERDAFLARLAAVHARLLTESASQAERCKPDDLPGGRGTVGSGPVAPDDMAAGLKTGDFVEFVASDGSCKRAKLAWEIPVTRTLLFTDERGLQAGHYTRETLAELFKQSRARVIGV